MLTLWKSKYFMKSIMTSKVIQGHKQWPFYLKFTFSSVLLLIDWRNKCRWTLWKNKVWLIQRRHLPCKKTKFALYKDDIKMKYDLRSNRTTLMLGRVCVAFLLSDLITFLTYILMDNFCPCFVVNLYQKILYWWI